MISVLLAVELKLSNMIVVCNAAGLLRCGDTFSRFCLISVTLHFSSCLGLFNFLSLIDCQSPSSSLLRFLIVTSLYWIWYVRNSATFRNSRLKSQGIVDLIFKDIKSRIRCAFTDTVWKFWSKGSVLCSLDENGNITFSI